MQAIIDFVTANPLYGIIGAALLVVLVVALSRKAMKIAVVVLVLNAVYGYYLNDLAHDTFESARQAAGHAVEQMQDGLEAGRSALDKAKEMLR